MITNQFDLEIRVRQALALLAALTFLSAAPAAAQKQKKNKPDSTDSSIPMPPSPTQDVLDLNIGEMLGAWQVGDIEAMHKYYDDGATFTSGAFEPPVIGFQNYVAAYQKARARFEGMQLIRKNTFIYFRADFAWASYQWELLATLDGQPYSARGQTTLVFGKTGDKWLIVHNHTSQVCEATAPAPAVKSQTPPPN
jgi:ketosteroid isomerase-like protein